MKVEIGTKAAQFPEKEYINGILVVVYSTSSHIISFLVDFREKTKNRQPHSHSKIFSGSYGTEQPDTDL
jgi:hypothetical protein